MRSITDFHIHSKYSRACSKELVPEKLHEWAQYKGIDIIGTGDFTHPLWFRELEEKLEPAESGLYRLKTDYRRSTIDERKFRDVRFILTAEVSSIYTQGGTMRRIHTILVVPSFAAARTMNKELANIGNLTADGRPILGLSAKDLARIAFDVDPTCMVIPAHAWTPWFAIFGSKSGFDSIEECFGDLAPEIFAMETGLSSDPEMNWRLSALDRIALVSCSDAHSLPNLGREATIFDLPDLSYGTIRDALRTKDTKRLVGTIEFYPEEGKYHHDGHAIHQVSLTPTETKQANYHCPVCQQPVTVGVLHRVDALADRPFGERPEGMPDSFHIVPLREIIADALGVAKTSKKVQAEYWQLIHGLGNEFSLLLDRSPAELAQVASSRIVEGIARVRSGRVSIRPGYDGVYGEVKVFDGENDAHDLQAKLF